MASPLPWLYPYAAERAPRRGREVLRPLVPLGLSVTGMEMVPRAALIDSGAESVLAAGWLADLIGIDLATSEDRATIGIGGQVVEVTFVEVDLRLHALHDAEESILWRADVGFVPGWQAPFPVVLGQVGFLDSFTVTFSRGAAMVAVEDWAVFDNRFGTGAPI